MRRESDDPLGEFDNDAHSTIVRTIVLVPGLLAAAVGAALMGSTRQLLYDDSYTFLRYANHLAAGQGFSYNGSDPSYGFSSPLWEMLLGIVRTVVSAGAMPRTVQVLGILLLVATTYLIQWTVSSLTNPCVGWLAAVTYALIPLWSTVWAVSGMESPLLMASVAFLVAAVTIDRLRHPLIVGCAVAVLLLTRTDHLPTAVVLVGYFIVTTSGTGARLRNLTIVSVSAIMPVIAWSGYAYATFGSVLPWSSEGRMAYYLPLDFGITRIAYEHAGLATRLRIAIDAWRNLLLHGTALPFLTLPLLAAAGLAAVAAVRNPNRRTALCVTAAAAAILQLVAYGLTYPLVERRHFPDIYGSPDVSVGRSRSFLTTG